jgi:hypothetical protein
LWLPSLEEENWFFLFLVQVVLGCYFVFGLDLFVGWVLESDKNKSINIKLA